MQVPCSLDLTSKFFATKEGGGGHDLSVLRHTCFLREAATPASMVSHQVCSPPEDWQ